MQAVKNVAAAVGLVLMGWLFIVTASAALADESPVWGFWVTEGVCQVDLHPTGVSLSYSDSEGRSGVLVKPATMTLRFPDGGWVEVKVVKLSSTERREHTKLFKVQPCPTTTTSTPTTSPTSTTTPDGTSSTSSSPTVSSTSSTIPESTTTTDPTTTSSSTTTMAATPTTTTTLLTTSTTYSTTSTVPDSTTTIPEVVTDIPEPPNTGRAVFVVMALVLFVGAAMSWKVTR